MYIPSGSNEPFSVNKYWVVFAQDTGAVMHYNLEILTCNHMYNESSQSKGRIH